MYFNSAISTSSDIDGVTIFARHGIPGSDGIFLMRFYLHHHLDVMERQFLAKPRRRKGTEVAFFYGRFEQGLKSYNYLTPSYYYTLPPPPMQDYYVP